MKPAQLNVTIYQGANWRLPIAWATGTKQSSVPVNMTGYTLRAQGRQNHDSEDTIFDLTLDDGIDWVDQATGKFALVLTAEQTSELTTALGVYDVEAVSPGGQVFRLVEGQVKLSREVTR